MRSPHDRPAVRVVRRAAYLVTSIVIGAIGVEAPLASLTWTPARYAYHLYLGESRQEPLTVHTDEDLPETRIVMDDQLEPYLRIVPDVIPRMPAGSEKEIALVFHIADPDQDGEPPSKPILARLKLVDRDTGQEIGAPFSITLDLFRRNCDPHEETDHLEIDAFVGQVLNRFASRSRADLLNPEESRQSDTDNLAGISLNSILRRGCYRFNPTRTTHEWEVNIYGEAIHSARVVETPCEQDPNDPTSADKCEAMPALDPNGALKVIRDSDTLEWLGGVQYVFATFNEQDEIGVYAKAQYGFLRAPKSGDDLIDDSFYGFGLEYRTGIFTGSYLETGLGRTDLFAPGSRSHRVKVNAGIYYTPLSRKDQPQPYSVFVEALLDSKPGRGSDDIQIYYGLAFSIDRLLGRLLPKEAGGD